PTIGQWLTNPGIHADGAQATPTTAEDGMLVLFGNGDSIPISSAEEGARFLLVSGKPLREQVAWRGLEEGSFVKHGAR
ncbi:MAG: hypothetical protein M1617_07285, partial [Actinobacteria bacterium]|nr:hypothetical protein [Actinomycetota bacterium]